MAKTKMHVATMEDITTYGRDGSMRIKAGGAGFDALRPSAYTPHSSRELTHRRWEPISSAAEMGNTINRVSVTEMESNHIPRFLKDAVEVELRRPVAEMLTTTQGAMDLLEKVRIDVDLGLAEAPILYQPLYERVNGPFPGGVVMIGSDITVDANVLFQEKFEGGEIVFGTLARSGSQSPVAMHTYAAGFEWTEDMIEYDRSYEIGMNARAFGRSYNWLLNHLHLSPIIAFSYAGGNSTAAVTGQGSLQANTLVQFQQAYRTGAMATIQRIPTWILANEADRFQIEDALLTPVLDAQGNMLRRVPVEGIIYYNGATVTNGVVSQTYPGVTAGTCYFITPRTRLKELVHHDLRIDLGPEDISRLIEGQQVARTRRSSYLDIANAVQKITLSTATT